MIYLDNSATTKPCRECIEEMTDMLANNWGNPSSLHRLGIEAQRKLHLARLRVSNALGADADRVFFTSGGTEADNWAVFSAAQKLGKRGRHIVSTEIEHHAILNPLARLESQGFTVTYLKPDYCGTISSEDLEKALTPDTVLVSVMMVNNETGAVLPIDKMAKLTHRVCPNAIFHTDAVQSFLKIPFRASGLDVDMISISGHKVHGPKGVGALYIRKGLSMPPYLYGGGQESALRSGTEALPAIAGFGAACEAGYRTMRKDIAEENRLKEFCLSLLRSIPEVQLIGAASAPHIINLAVSGVRSQGLINCLQDKEIYVSAGSACAKGHRSHVLEAMKIPPELIDGSIRISLCKDTTEQDIISFCEGLKSAIVQLQ